jgi:hypothetical protein
VRRPCSDQPLFFAGTQSPGADRLRRGVEPDHVDAMTLERRVVSVAVRDGPIEEVSDARFESIQGHVAALGAPASERRRPPQFLRDRLARELEGRDLLSRLASRFDSGQA